MIVRLLPGTTALALAAILVAPPLAPRSRAADAPPDAREIIARVKASRAEGERRELEMEILPKRGRSSKRKLVVLTHSRDGEDRMLVRFVEPHDVARLGLLTIQRRGEEDDQHIYVPTLKKTKRIAASNRTDLFAATDFSYEDLRAENLDAHAYRLLGEETAGGERCYKIEATPRTEEERQSSGYSRREILVSTKRPVILEIRMFDKRAGTLVKVARFSDVRDVGGHPKAHRVEMENRPRESRTVAITTSWTVDRDLKADDLTPFKLERGN